MREGDLPSGGEGLKGNENMGGDGTADQERL